MKPAVLRVAVPAPLRRCFDYALPDTTFTLCRGMRVRVPFGRREIVGFLIGIADQSVIKRERLKSVLRVLDSEPVLPEELLSLLLV